MPQTPTGTPGAPIVYPDSDGMPMADNSLQADWIFRVYHNLGAQFAREENVVVGADMLWYAVEGDPDTRRAPDVFVVFGRPKGYRGSYKTWEENDVPLTVAFEVWSPCNTDKEMADKRQYYEDHGVEEYYMLDPETPRVEAFVRQGSVFRRQWQLDRFVSPRLGIRFEIAADQLRVYGPDGRLFLGPEEMEEGRLKLLAHTREVEQQVTNEKARADEAKLRADNEAKLREEEKLRADAAVQRARRLAELSRKARRQQATPDELAELDRLEAEEAPA